MPGIGKTTICEKIYNLAVKRGKTVSGFLTKEKRENNKRVGFQLVCLNSGDSTLMAHIDKNKITGTIGNVGKYFVDVSAVEKFILKFAGEIDSDLVVIDEIGKMELLSSKVCSVFDELIFDSNHTVISTIPEKSNHKFITKIRDNFSSNISKITHNNRDKDWDDIILKKIFVEKPDNSLEIKKLKNRAQNIKKNITKINKLKEQDKAKLNNDQLNKISRLAEFQAELEHLNLEINKLQ